MTPRSRKGTLLCLAGLVCLPGGGGFSPHAILNAAARPSSVATKSRRTSAVRPTLIPEEAAAAVMPPTGRRNLRRPRAETMSQAMFPSISRTPLPPGGVYEGEKKERGNTEEGDFNRNVGKVIDTLKRDYPRMFTEPLDFDIYTPDLQLRDPSGMVLTGLPSYQRLFATLRFFRQILVSEVATTLCISYDGSRQQVRVTWHFVLDATPVVARPIHVDGISVYSLSAKGLVRRHDIETIIVNGTPAKPPFAKAWIHLPSWVSKGLNGGAAAPGFTNFSGGVVGGSGFDFFTESCVGDSARGIFAPVFHSERHVAFAPLGSSVSRQLPAAWENSARVTLASVAASVASVIAGLDGNSFWAASEESAEGLTRQGEGDEGAEAGSDTGKDESGDSDNQETPKPKKRQTKKQQQKKKKGFWPIEYDGPLGCETSWDCTGGYVCCDLILLKICCSNGIMQRKPGDLIPLLTPIPGRGRTELDQCAPRR